MEDRIINKKWTKYRGTLFLFGICCSLIMVFSAFQLTVPQYTLPEEIEWIPPADIHQIPPTRHREIRKKPPVQKVQKVKLDIPPKLVTETVEYIEDDLMDSYDEEEDFTGESFVEEHVNEGRIEPVKKEEDPIFIHVARMPVFGDCNDLEDEKERNKCSEKALFDYVYNTIQYPSIARENGIEGRVTATLVVDENGNVTQIEILRHPGGGLDKVVEKMLLNMPSWEPGLNNFKPVKVRYTIPVTFEFN